MAKLKGDYSYDASPGVPGVEHLEHQAGVPGVAHGHTDVCVRMLPIPVRSHPACEGLYLKACMAQGRILFWLDP